MYVSVAAELDQKPDSDLGLELSCVYKHPFQEKMKAQTSLQMSIHTKC